MSTYRGASSATDMALDLKGLLRAIGRSLRWLLPLVVIVAATVFVLLAMSPKKYLGSARVLIESTTYGLPGPSRGVEEERALLDAQGVASQVQLLISADLASRVVDRLQLDQVAEFQEEGQPGMLDKLLGLVGLGEKAGTGSREEEVLKAYFKRINVYRLEGSRVIAVEFTSHDPKLAAKVANTIVDEYLALQEAAKRQTTEVATLSLQPQIVELRKEVQDARKAIADFRSGNDLLLGSGNQTLLQQQLVELGTSYNSALSARDEAEAKASQVRGLLTSGAALESASDVLNSQLIQRLRERQAELQANVSELSITLLPNHPQLKALQSQLRDYDRLIREEAKKVLAGLESDARVAAQQAETLGTRLQDLKQQVARSNADQVRLDELEREAAAKASQLDTLVASYREADTRLKSQVLPADARIISRAIVPIEPYAPKVVASTILAAVATFFLGCACVVAWAFLSGTALYPVSYEQEQEETVADTSVQTVPMPAQTFSAGFAQAPYSPVMARYVSDMAVPAPAPAAALEPDPRADLRLNEAEETAADEVITDSAPVSADEDREDAPAEEEVIHLAEQRGGEEVSQDPDAPAVSRAPGPVSEDASGNRAFARSLFSNLAAAGQPEPSEDQPQGITPFDQAAVDPTVAEDASFEDIPAETASSQDAETVESSVHPEASDPEAPIDRSPGNDDLFQSLDGVIVVLTVDNPQLSHRCAFHLARAAADRGQSSLMLEAYPELQDAQAARGFSDLVAGEATFAKVIYGDAGSTAHLIEAGSKSIPDDIARQPRFVQTLEVIASMYETVVVDLGAIDGTLASVQIMRKAERVLLMADSAELGPELEAAADLLRRNSRARVEVFAEGDLPGEGYRDANHAA